MPGPSVLDSIAVVYFTAYSYLASALINDDPSGIEPTEEPELRYIEHWLTENSIRVIDCAEIEGIEEPEIGQKKLPGDCAWYEGSIDIDDWPDDSEEQERRNLFTEAPFQISINHCGRFEPEEIYTGIRRDEAQSAYQVACDQLNADQLQCCDCDCEDCESHNFQDHCDPCTDEASYIDAHDGFGGDCDLEWKCRTPAPYEDEAWVLCIPDQALEIEHTCLADAMADAMVQGRTAISDSDLSTIQLLNHWELNGEPHPDDSEVYVMRFKADEDDYRAYYRMTASEWIEVYGCYSGTELIDEVHSAIGTA